MLAGSLATGMLAGGSIAAASEHMLVIDTHVHCFAGTSSSAFPYHPQAPYRPVAPTPPELLLTRMDEAGVDRACVVQPEPYHDDHRYLEHCLQIGDGRLKGTCLFFASQETSQQTLRELVNRNSGNIVALRVHAYAPERLPPFEATSLRDLWRTAADLNLAIQLHFEPRYAPFFEPLIRMFSKTTVVIDHLGRPLQGTPAEHAVVVGWADFPNTIMKISSLSDSSQYPHRDLAPIVKDLSLAYGSSRLIYGGGFDEHASGISYRGTRERIASMLEYFTPEEQAQIFGGNAAKLFRFL